jgi:hypothetical protein
VAGAPITAVVCSDSDSGATSADTVTFKVAAGEKVSCDVTNHVVIVDRCGSGSFTHGVFSTADVDAFWSPLGLFDVERIFEFDASVRWCHDGTRALVDDGRADAFANPNLHAALTRSVLEELLFITYEYNSAAETIDVTPAGTETNVAVTGEFDGCVEPIALGLTILPIGKTSAELEKVVQMVANDIAKGKYKTILDAAAALSKRLTDKIEASRDKWTDAMTDALKARGLSVTWAKRIATWLLGGYETRAKMLATHLVQGGAGDLLAAFDRLFHFKMCGPVWQPQVTMTLSLTNPKATVTDRAQFGMNLDMKISFDSGLP